jgi:hypothetical protein
MTQNKYEQNNCKCIFIIKVDKDINLFSFFSRTLEKLRFL